MTDALIVTEQWSQFYTLYLDGTLEIRGMPSREDFEATWFYVMNLKNVLNRWIGNLLCHAEKAEWGGEDYITEIAEMTGRSKASIYQIHSTYSRLSQDAQVEGVKYSYDLHAAKLPKPLQRPMLEDVAAGKYKNSDEFNKAVKTAIREPNLPRPTTTKPLPIPCPICGGNGFEREQLSWYECPNPHCGTHADELLDKFNLLLDAVREFYQTGWREPLDEFVQPYKWT